MIKIFNTDPIFFCGNKWNHNIYATPFHKFSVFPNKTGNDSLSSKVFAFLYLYQHLPSDSDEVPLLAFQTFYNCALSLDVPEDILYYHRLFLMFLLDHSYYHKEKSDILLILSNTHFL